MKIIVDAFGGDNAPLEILKGCSRAVRDLGVSILLTGSEKEIRRVAEENGVPLEGMGIVDAPDAVSYTHLVPPKQNACRDPARFPLPVHIPAFLPGSAG